MNSHPTEGLALWWPVLHAALRVRLISTSHGTVSSYCARNRGCHQCDVTFAHEDGDGRHGAPGWAGGLGTGWGRGACVRPAPRAGGADARAHTSGGRLSASASLGTPTGP